MLLEKSVSTYKSLWPSSGYGGPGGLLPGGGLGTGGLGVGGLGGAGKNFKFVDFHLLHIKASFKKKTDPSAITIMEPCCIIA